MRVDMEAGKKLDIIITKLLLRGRKLNNFTCFYITNILFQSAKNLEKPILTNACIFYIFSNYDVFMKKNQMTKH